MGVVVTAAFNISPVSGTGSAATPLTVTYTDASSGSPTSYFWDLNGDGVIDSNRVGGTLTHDFYDPVDLHREVDGFERHVDPFHDADHHGQPTTRADRVIRFQPRWGYCAAVGLIHE